MYFDLTLRKMFQIAGLPEPDSFPELIDDPIDEISTKNLWKEKTRGLRVCVGYIFENSSVGTYLKMIDEGVVVITYKQIYYSDGSPARMILLPKFNDVRHLWVSLGKWMREQLMLPLIAITGSVGKTTTTAFIERIFEQKYKIFATTNNANNSELIVREMLRNLNGTHTMHIQEIGGGAQKQVERVASALRPNYFVITTVLPHHMNNYKTIEKVIEDKTSLDTCADDNAFGVINIDNEHLRNHKFVHRTVTCGIQHQEADYVAKNIRQDGAWLKLDVYMRKSGEICPVQVKILGEHNAYNVLLSFALAKEYGFHEQIICDGLSNFRTDFIRQNYTEISGRFFYIDCFNHAVESIKAALKTTHNLEISPGNRKIAVLGGENALGGNAFSVNFKLGLSLCEYDTIDEFVFFGSPEGTSEAEIDRIGNAYAVYQGAKRVIRDKKISYCSSREELADKFVRETKPGDIILLKGIFHLPLWPVVDLAFGTALTMRSGVVPVTRAVMEANYRGVYYDYVNGVNLSRGGFSNGKLSIPDTIDEKPVYRTGRDNFRNHQEITSVDFGNAIVNIGTRSFMNCKNIKSIELPKSVLHIEEGAFRDCRGIKTVVMHGVEHISSKAFANCVALTKVYISKCCCYIENDAFDNCPKLTIISESEYVASWAAKNGVSILRQTSLS